MSNMVQITPSKVRLQWFIAPFKFRVNLWNFEVTLGKEAQKIFKESFKMQKFNAPGSSKWEKRVSKKEPFRPILIESWSLRDSIKWKRQKSGAAHTVKIYTDPNGFSHTKRHQGFCYAAVHNAPNGLGYRRGRVRYMPQRQFMGHTPVLRQKIREIETMIFKGIA